MVDSDINLERFAHDVCVHVLEKFSIFKAPDDTRKQNKYMYYDTVPCISRSVVSYSFLIRDSFKSALENKYETADPSEKGKMWNFFDQYLLKNAMYVGDCDGKMCMSLAICTEYIQFASIKKCPVSLNKVVARWSDFFDEHLKETFEKEDGLVGFYTRAKISQVGELDNFHIAFILEYCLPYGSNECTIDLAKECIERYGFSFRLENTIFGLKMRERILKEAGLLRRHSATSKESKSGESGTSDSESDSSSTSNSDSKESQNVGSETSDSEMSTNNLLGIPPHEDVLRKIDPFFVENIPSPPKPRLSKSPEREANPSDSSPRPSSKSPEREAGLIDDAPLPASSKSPEREADPSDDAPHKASLETPEGATGHSDNAPLRASSEIPEREAELCDNSPFPASSKSPEREADPSDDAPHQASSEIPEGTIGPSDDAPPHAYSKSPKREAEHSDGPPSLPSEQEELKEMVEQIFTKLEHDMDTLRRLLFDHGLLSGRTGIRRRVSDANAKNMPRGPEGLI